MGERVRFSPAPSGSLHLGGARTALFNYLVARSGGTFVLRFEDTDAVRSDARFEAGIIEDLAWLGLHWDEGPDVGGPRGPYRQSVRGRLYAAALDRLASEGRVYRCFCDEETLAAQRAEDLAAGVVPRYRGTCRHIDPAASAARAASGERYGWRFAVEGGEDVVVDDAVHGPVRFRREDIGDFLVARSDGAVLYDLACVVDDDAMSITLVVRGDDHLSNTPRQLLLFDALGATTPRYAHVPLVLGADGRPLSKSRGAEGIAELRAQGYLPSAVLNHLALLGWSDPAGREVLQPLEIAAAFDLGRVSSSSPTHDPARLRWLNRRHMAALPRQDRVALVASFLPPLPGVGAERAAELVADDVEVAGDAARLVAGVVAPLAPDGAALSALASPTAPRALELAAHVVTAAPNGASVRMAVREAGLPAREALPAVRAALTGRAHGLPIDALVEMIGADASAERLRRASVG